MKRITSLLAALLLASAPACAVVAPSPPLPPPPNDLVAKVVARDQATQDQLRAMQYREAIHSDQLDAQGGVTHQQDTQMIVQPGAHEPFHVLSVRGDRIPGDPDEAVRQAKGQETERRKHDFSLRILAARFQIANAGIGTCLGAPAYLLSFEPKPNQPFRDQTEKVLNQLHGRIWVDPRTNVVLRIEATLAHPVTVAWIFAKITRLDFQYEMRSLTNLYGPSHLQVFVEVATPIWSVRQRQSVDLTDFQPVEKI